MTEQLENQRIGIYGGTFDPVHNGHLMVARLAMAAAGLQKVVFVPSGTPPHKEDRALTGPHHRLAMVRLAIQALPGYEVSDLEIATPGVDYTVDTLLRLKQSHPRAALHFIIGGDSLMYLDQWREPQELMRLAVFVAVYRPGCRLEELEQKRQDILNRFGGEIVLVECPGMDISSSAIRQMAAAGEDISGMVPSQVAAYIRQNGLYKQV